AGDVPRTTVTRSVTTHAARFAVIASCEFSHVGGSAAVTCWAPARAITHAENPNADPTSSTPRPTARPARAAASFTVSDVLIGWAPSAGGRPRHGRCMNLLGHRHGLRGPLLEAVERPAGQQVQHDRGRRPPDPPFRREPVTAPRRRQPPQERQVGPPEVTGEPGPPR